MRPGVDQRQVSFWGMVTHTALPNETGKDQDQMTHTSLFDQTAIDYGYRELALYPNGDSMQYFYLQLTNSLRHYYNEPVDAEYAFEDPENKKHMWRAEPFD